MGLHRCSPTSNAYAGAGGTRDADPEVTAVTRQRPRLRPATIRQLLRRLQPVGMSVHRAVVGSLDNLPSAVETAPPRRLAEEGASFHQHLFFKLDRYKLANLAGWHKIFCDVHASYGEFPAHDTEQALVIRVEYT